MVARPYRASDPVTSVEAASGTALGHKTVRDAVLAVLDRFGPVTQERLVTRYRVEAQDSNAPWASDSSIRTRCSELVRAGLVERVPNEWGKTSSGHRACLWQTTKLKEGGRL